MSAEELIKRARTYNERDKFDEAYAIAKQAILEIGSEPHDALPELLEIIAVANAFLERARGQSMASEELDKLTKVATEQAYPQSERDHGRMAVALAAFGEMYYAREQYDTAERILQQCTRYLQDSDIDVPASFLQSFEVLVYSQCWQRKFDQALETCSRWLKLAEDELVENDIYTATIYKNLGDIYWAKGDLATADEHYKKCIWLHENANCEECSDLPEALRCYSKLLREMGRESEALEAEQRAAALA